MSNKNKKNDPLKEKIEQNNQNIINIPYRLTAEYRAFRDCAINYAKNNPELSKKESAIVEKCIDLKEQEAKMVNKHNIYDYKDEEGLHLTFEQLTMLTLIKRYIFYAK